MALINNHPPSHSLTHSLAHYIDIVLLSYHFINLSILIPVNISYILNLDYKLTIDYSRRHCLQSIRHRTNRWYGRDYKNCPEGISNRHWKLKWWNPGFLHIRVIGWYRHGLYNFWMCTTISLILWMLWSMLQVQDVDFHRKYLKHLSLRPFKWELKREINKMKKNSPRWIDADVKA